MKPLYLIGVCALALGAAACHPPAKRLTRLDCPAQQGDLTRISASVDGRTCGYVSSTGAEISLRIVDVQGGLEPTLARLEQELRSYIPKQTAAAPAATAQGAATTAPIETAAVAPAAGAVEAAARASAEARADAAAAKLNVQVGDHDHHGSEVVKVQIPGIKIEADDANDSADIQIGGMHIQAGEEGAVMRQRRDVRLRGEALSREKRGVRARLIIAGDQVGPDYSYLEYEVGGRKSGPLAVALVRSKTGEAMGHDHGDVEKLVRRNGGV